MPSEFWDMTLKEFALYHQGVSQRIDREMRQLAWVTANLMNCWISKGPKMTVDKLLPKPKQKKASEEGATATVVGELPSAPPQTLEEAKQRARERIARKHAEEADTFWESPEGRRLAAQMDEL